jgi:phosphatidylglycerol:prolipoprotein diacylglycerol transferase
LDRVCFHIAGRPIYWYGVLMAAGFCVALVHLTLLGRRDRREPSFAADLAFWLMLGGIVGGRLAYVISEFGHFRAAPAEIWRVDQGGLIYYGGVLGGLIAMALFAWRRHLPVRGLMDFVATALPLGHAFGRVGCFLNGCCQGVAAATPWGIRDADGVSRLPVQLVEAAFNAVLYLVLLRFYRHRPAPATGRVAALYFMTYPVGRFLLEFLRGDARMQWGGLTVAQWISAGLVATGAILWATARRGHDPAHGPA